ncbi:MAG: HD family phosphohydrolase, partial [Bacillota bacterium]|nr:HD family phosphohydrolase [Bacillota bacterium]
SVLVILNKITGRRIKRFTNIKKIDVYYNHGEIGFNILTKLNRYDDKFLFMVRNHHDNGIIGDMELDILRKADSMN